MSSTTWLRILQPVTLSRVLAAYGNYGGQQKVREKAVGCVLSISTTMNRYQYFFLTLFGKGEKANLSKAERNDLAKLTSLLVKNYGGQYE